MNEEKVSDELTAKIADKVAEIRSNKKWRREYMHALLHDQDIRYETEAEVKQKYEKLLVDKDALIKNKDILIADKDAEIARLKELLNMS